MHSIRVMDYIFPLDSSFLNSKAKDRKKFPPFGDLRTIKRITTCEKDLKSGTWCYHLEEKNFEREKIYKGIATYKYFIEWLQSLGDMRAFRLSELIGDYINRLGKVQFQSSLLHLGRGAGRVYQKCLGERTRAFIDGNPWYKRVHSLDIESGQGTLRRLVLNEKYIGLFADQDEKVYSPDIYGPGEGFHFMENTLTDDWVGLWLRYFWAFFFLKFNRRFAGGCKSFELPEGVEEPMFWNSIDQTFVYVGDKRHLGSWLIYQEKYSENYCMIEESTVVWIPSGFVSIHQEY